MTVTSTPSASTHHAHAAPTYTHSHGHSNTGTPSPSKRHHLAFDRQLLAQATAAAAKSGNVAAGSPLWALARHLQLRLQYARLKVDHGWQKQSINEVENLYFHHRHGVVSNSSNAQPSTNRASTNTSGNSNAPTNPGPTAAPSATSNRAANPPRGPTSATYVKIAPAPAPTPSSTLVSTASGTGGGPGGSTARVEEIRHTLPVTHTHSNHYDHEPPSPHTPLAPARKIDENYDDESVMDTDASPTTNNSNTNTTAMEASSRSRQASHLPSPHTLSNTNTRAPTGASGFPLRPLTPTAAPHAGTTMSYDSFWSSHSHSKASSATNANTANGARR